MRAAIVCLSIALSIAGALALSACSASAQIGAVPTPAPTAAPVIVVMPATSAPAPRNDGSALLTAAALICMMVISGSAVYVLISALNREPAPRAPEPRGYFTPMPEPPQINYNHTTVNIILPPALSRDEAIDYIMNNYRVTPLQAREILKALPPPLER